MATKTKRKKSERDQERESLQKIKTRIIVMGHNGDYEEQLQSYETKVKEDAVGWLLQLAETSGLMKAMEGELHIGVANKLFKKFAAEVKAIHGKTPEEVTAGTSPGID